MKKSKIKNLMAINIFAITIIFSFSTVSCDQNSKKNKKDTDVSEDVSVIEEDIWFIDERKINDIPLTTTIKPSAPENKEKPKAKSLKETDAVKTVTVLSANFQEVGYEAEQQKISKAVIPLNETQTLTSFSKKGKKESEVQVISNGDGEIDQIVFTHKKHKDIYNVQVGMSGKEVKKLRRKLKHMMKKGQMFLYDDDSNIMYLMATKTEKVEDEEIREDAEEVQESAKGELTDNEDIQEDVEDVQVNEKLEADIENMEVQAIIWKNKKHRKK